MTKKTKTILIGSAFAVVTTFVILGIWHSLQPDTSEPIAGFGRIIDKTKNTHPEIFAWWETLDVNQQKWIEDAMKQSGVIDRVYEEMKKNELSPWMKERLKLAGYKGIL